MKEKLFLIFIENFLFDRKDFKMLMSWMGSPKAIILKMRPGWRVPHFVKSFLNVEKDRSSFLPPVFRDDNVIQDIDQLKGGTIYCSCVGNLLRVDFKG